MPNRLLVSPADSQHRKKVDIPSSHYAVSPKVLTIFGADFTSMS